MIMKLHGKKVVIVGGGQIALRKAKGLAGTGAAITVISPRILKELEQLHDVAWKQKEFEEKDIEGAHLIFAATSNKSINKNVCACADDFQWVNDISDSEYSSFITPAIVRREKFILTISTSGASPILAKKLKQELEERYDDKMGELVNAYEKRRNKK
ncbi:precorrin-2 dehydrogenase/sirohydrochlorin ferrochelatase family protein [Oceanobacillus profundus]|uniref:precorrin-2 dehydrogenase/sirohydrochlorin ferrochelatase family protein n=1 Tax=Oceanobacillus profundus TaxID=372463 RepID=UPI0036D2A7C6